MKAVTLIRTLNPPNVGKTFTIQSGTLQKQSAAAISEAIGKTVLVPDCSAMAELLRQVTSTTDLVICNGIFRGAGEEEFRIVTEKKFRKIVEDDGADFGEVIAQGELYRTQYGAQAGSLIGARLKALQDPSSWFLLDADRPAGFPEEWLPLNLQQRLELLEPYAPGLATAERVELRGSTARVVKAGHEAGKPSHAWVCADEADDIARAAAALMVHAVNDGVAFMSPRYRKGTKEVIGHQPRTTIDLATWHTGRLNFDSCPNLEVEGHTLADANVTIVNPGGGVFSPHQVRDVASDDRATYRAHTGHNISISRDGTSVMVTEEGQLTLDTPIERRGDMRSLGEWAEYMRSNELQKLRCEAPFRESHSEAAFIGWEASGPFVYDVGVATKYRLSSDLFEAIVDVEQEGVRGSPSVEAKHEDDEDLDLIDSMLPEIDEVAFYGPLARIADEATANSEATKVGVCCHLMAMFATLVARPFYVSVGDERVGLNVFLVQVGRSAKGRKGTSEQFANRYLQSGFAKLASIIDGQHQLAMAAAEEAKFRVEKAHDAVERMRNRIARLETLTHEVVAALLAPVSTLEEDLNRERSYRASYANKIKRQDRPLSPATARKYETAIFEHNNRITSLVEQLDEIRQAHDLATADLANREYLREALPAELARLENALAMATEAMTRHEDHQPEHWLRNFLRSSAPPNFMGGIASGAAIINKIRDEAEVIKDGRPESIPGIDDKRLLISLSEFGAVLQALRRPGMQVAEVWRLAFDCRPLETGAKTDPCACREPFVNVSASITPKELYELLFNAKDNSAAADNGFANRQLYLYVARNKLVPRPSPTARAEEMVAELFENALAVYEQLKPDAPHLRTEIEFAEDGAKRWDQVYREIDALDGVSVNAGKLFGRMSTYARKLSALLALMAGEAKVSAAAIDAALAWVRYAAATVNAVAASREERLEARRLRSDMETVIRVLRKEGADAGILVPRRDILRSVRVSSKCLDNILTELERMSPPWVRLEVEQVRSGNGTIKRKVLVALTEWAPT